MRKLSSSNAENEAELIAACPLAAALRLVGGRWKPMVLYYVHHGLDRPVALRQRIARISSKMLFEQLSELQLDGLLQKRANGRYQLTDLGASLLPVLDALKDWSVENGIQSRAADAALRRAG